MRYTSLIYVVVALHLIPQISALLVPLPSIPQANCFTSGQTNHNQAWAKTQVQDVCKDHLLGKYRDKLERHWCFNDGPNCWVMRAKLNGDDEKSLALDECVTKLKLIIDSCVPYGGKKKSDDFGFTADPNGGHCPEGINDEPPTSSSDDSSPPQATSLSSSPSTKGIEPDESCNSQQVEKITTEFDYAFKIAKKAESITGASEYYKTLFSAGNTQPANLQLQIQTKYKRYGEILAGKGRYEHTNIACQDRNNWCLANVMAYILDEVQYQPLIVLCPTFFNNDITIPTDTVLRECKLRSPNAGNWDQLYKYGGVAAFTLLHELSHSLHVFGSNDRPAIDYGYGMRNSSLLAQGRLIGGVNGDCNKYPDQRCPAELSLENPDNWVYAAFGEYFSQACDRTIRHDFQPADAKIQQVDARLPDKIPANILKEMKPSSKE